VVAMRIGSVLLGVALLSCTARTVSESEPDVATSGPPDGGASSQGSVSGGHGESPPGGASSAPESLEPSEPPEMAISYTGEFPTYEECEDFGLEYTAGCDDCSTEPRWCDCLEANFFPPLTACDFGRCLAPLDCD